MSPLTTVAHGSSNLQSLEIHATIACSATTARNLFLVKIMCSHKIDFNNGADLDYLWDVMYNATWPESTYKRFKEDVKNLRDSPLPQNIIVPDGFHKELKDLCTGWLTMMESVTVDHLLVDR